MLTEFYVGVNATRRAGSAGIGDVCVVLMLACASSVFFTQDRRSSRDHNVIFSSVRSTAVYLFPVCSTLAI